MTSVSLPGEQGAAVSPGPSSNAPPAEARRERDQQAPSAVSLMLSYARPEQGLLTLSAALATLSVVCQILPFVFLYVIIDEVLSAPIDEGRVWLFVALTFGAILGRFTLYGAALFASEGRRPAAGGALGAAAALASAYAGERLRLRAAEKLGVHDPVVALLEDGLVLLAGERLLV